MGYGAGLKIDWQSVLNVLFMILVMAVSIVAFRFAWDLFGAIAGLIAAMVTILAGLAVVVNA